MARKKIGIFSSYYLPHLGGVERYTDKLSAALVKLGYEVVIVTTNYGDLSNFEQTGHRAVYRLPVYKLAKARYPILKHNDEYKALMRMVEAEKIDYFLLNTRFYLTSLVGGKLGYRSGRPVVLIEHGTGHFTVNNRWLDFVGKLYEHLQTYRIKRYVDKFYGVSLKCNTWLKHFSIHASGVFYNAIEVADKRRVKDYYTVKYPEGTVVITYAGRLVREKGVLNLLEAFQEAKKKNRNIDMKLVIAGDGDLLKSINEDYAGTYIDVLGKLDFDHVMALYKRSDIFVYPSLYPEGLPTSILEAGLMGCAVIATPKGGTEEVIIDRQHGIIVDGSIESLRAAIEELAADSHQRAELADTIRRRIESTFNWEVVAKKVDHEINHFNTE